ncbi:MAG: hypothetical protein ACUVTX_02550, partial [Bacteroidales bacterium]
LNINKLILLFFTTQPPDRGSEFHYTEDKASCGEFRGVKNNEGSVTSPNLPQCGVKNNKLQNINPLVFESFFRYSLRRRWGFRQVNEKKFRRVKKPIMEKLIYFHKKIFLQTFNQIEFI